jgi:phage tail sheath protein FI
MTMGRYRAPDVYVEEVPGGARPIEAVGTSLAAFIGIAPDANARLNEPVPINNWTQFIREFIPEDALSTDLSQAVFGFFQNGGGRCYVVNVGEDGVISGGGRTPRGVDVLEQIDDISIVAAPGFTDAASYNALLTHCEKLEDRVAVLDAPESTPDIEHLTRVATVQESAPRGRGRRRGSGDEPSATSESAPEDSSPTGTATESAQEDSALRARQSDGGYGVFCFPWLLVQDPLSPTASTVRVPPSGHVAGIWARTDATRGVHKAPANEVVRGALDLTQRLTRDELGTLNTSGVVCIRSFPRQGIRLWGARTLADSSSEYRYVSVRRLVNMIKESISSGTRWVVFEPNDYTLWKSIRRDVGAFLTGLWRGGALMGRTPEEAFYVKCDEETNPPDVIDAGMVVTLVGIAPVKPAEFVVFRISQTRGDAETES